jgi:hypothetical protein
VSIRQTSYLRLVPAAPLSDRDYHDALALVSEAAAADGTQPFERSTIESLLQLIPANRAGYFEYSNGGEAYGTANTFFVDAPFFCTLDWAEDAICETIGSWPLRDTCDFVPSLASSRPPQKLSDLLTRRQLRRNPWYCEVMRPSGIEHELKFWLSAPPWNMPRLLPRSRSTRTRLRGARPLAARTPAAAPLEYPGTLGASTPILSAHRS